MINPSGIIENFKSIWNSLKEIAWKVWVKPFELIRSLPIWVKTIFVVGLIVIALIVIIWAYRHRNDYKCL
jgi:hypothetical protein